MNKDISAIILCGGKERRFGSNKAKAIVSGKYLLDRVIERLTPITDQIIVVTAPEKTDILGEHMVQVVIDKYPGRGPLGGIYTGLLSTKNHYAVTVGCDMPFINTELIRYMTELAIGYDAVVPRLERQMLESLHAVYTKNCIPTIHDALENDKLSIYQIVQNLKVRYVEKAEYLKFDPDKRSFFNINYPEDLEKANQIAFNESRNDAQNSGLTQQEP